MNYAIVLRLLSYILLTEGALLLLPAVASLCYGEWFVMGVFLFTAASARWRGRCSTASRPRARSSTCGKAL